MPNFFSSSSRKSFAFFELQVGRRIMCKHALILKEELCDIILLKVFRFKKQLVGLRHFCVVWSTLDSITCSLNSTSDVVNGISVSTAK